jgi:energy-converting hydrogenase A subunit M
LFLNKVTSQLQNFQP